MRTQGTCFQQSDLMQSPQVYINSPDADKSLVMFPTKRLNAVAASEEQAYEFLEEFLSFPTKRLNAVAARVTFKGY